MVYFKNVSIQIRIYFFTIFICLSMVASALCAEATGINQINIKVRELLSKDNYLEAIASIDKAIAIVPVSNAEELRNLHHILGQVLSRWQTIAPEELKRRLLNQDVAYSYYFHASSDSSRTLTEKLQLVDKSISLSEQLYSRSSREYAVSLRCKGDLLQTAGRYAEAEQMFDKAASVYLAVAKRTDDFSDWYELKKIAPRDAILPDLIDSVITGHPKPDRSDYFFQCFEIIKLYPPDRIEPELLKLLNNPNDEIIFHSLETLKGIARTDRAVTRLQELFLQADLKDKPLLVSLLGTLNDRKAVSFLISLLDEKQDIEIRKSAINELRRLHAYEATSSLQNLLNGHNREIQLEAAVVLAEWQDKTVIPFLKKLPQEYFQRSNLINAVGLLGDSSLSQRILSFLADENFELRWAAAVALARLRSAAGAPVLRGALKSQTITSKSDSDFSLPALKTSWRRDEAAFLLAKLRDFTGLPELLELYVGSKGKDLKAAAALRSLAKGTTLNSLLLSEMKTSDAAVRRNAIITLGYLGGAPAVPALMEAAHDQNPGIRAATLGALVRIADKRSRNLFVSALKDADPSVRIAAVDGLSLFSDDLVRESLRHISKDSEPKIRQLALEALGYDKRSLPQFITALQDSDADVRSTAIRNIYFILQDEAVHYLVQMLDDRADFIRKQILSETMGDINIGRRKIRLSNSVKLKMIPKVVELLQDRDVAVRSGAIQWLSMLKDKTSITALEGLLKDEDASVRNEAEWALWRIDSSKYPEPLKLNRFKQYSNARKTTIQERPYSDLIAVLRSGSSRNIADSIKALAKHKDKNATQYVLQLLTDADAETRLAALNYLIEFGDNSSIGALLDDIRNGARFGDGIGRFLARYRSPDITASLLTILSEGNASVRERAIDVLEEYNEPSSAESIMPFLDDANPGVVFRAINALVKLKHRAAIPKLRSLSADKRNHSGEAALDALVQLGDEEIVDKIIKERLNSPEVEERIEAVKLLAKVDTDTAYDAMLKALDDTDDEVKLTIIDNIRIKKNVRRDVVPKLHALLNNQKQGHTVDTQNTKFLSALSEWHSFQVRPVILDTLVTIGDKRSIQLFAGLLKSGSNEERLIGLKGLKNIGSEEALNMANGLLQDPDATVRCEAQTSALNFTTFNCTRSLEQAKELFLNPHYQQTAAVLLAVCGDKSGNKTLLDSMTHENKKMELYYPCNKEITPIESKLIPFLIAVSKDTSSVSQLQKKYRSIKSDQQEYKAYTGLALAMLGDRSVLPDLYSYLRRTPEDLVTAGAIQILHEPELTPIVLELVKKGNESAVSEAWRLNDNSIVPLLHELLKTSNHKLQTAALLSLARLGVVPPRSAIQQATVNDDEHTDQRLLFSLLLKSGDYQSVMKRFIQTGSLTALSALYETLPPTEELKPLLEHKDNNIRSAGHLLQAQMYQENRDYRQQREQAAHAIRLVEPQLDTALMLWASFTKASAELMLAMPQAAVDTLDVAEKYLKYLTPDELEASQELFREKLFYMKGKALAAAGEYQPARNLLETALNLLKKKKSAFFDDARELASKLIGFVEADLGKLEVENGAKLLAQAHTDLKLYEPVNTFELDVLDSMYSALARQKAVDSEYEEAQKLAEEIELRKMKYRYRLLHHISSDPLNMADIQAYQRIKSELEAITKGSKPQKMPSLKSSGTVLSVSPEATGNNAGILAKKRRELHVFLEGLRKKKPDLYVLLAARPIELSVIQEYLPEHVAVLQYLVLADSVLIFVITKTEIDVKTSIVDKHTLFETIKIMQRAISRHDQADEKQKLRLASNQLYDLLVTPFVTEAKLSKVTHLGIIPNDILATVPFAALCDNAGHYLIERYSLFSLPSASYLPITQNRGNSFRANGPLLALANPDNTLAAAEREAVEIKNLFPTAHVFLKESASQKHLRQLLPESSILHLSTHGHFDQANPERSYLVLADGPLSIEDIWSLPLSKTQLTTLSACDTKLAGKASRIGLESSFFDAGTPAVISALWKVDDAATSLLMTVFYRELKTGKGRAVALKAAQTTLASSQKNPAYGSDYSSPYYWAAFMISGDWR